MYDDVFGNIKSRSRIEVYEQIFIKQTGIKYKDFLFKKYMEENLSQEAIANLLNIHRSKLAKHLSHYGITKNNNKSSNDIYIKTIGMVEKETGRKFEDIYNELTEEGLSPTEIADKLRLRSMSSISSYLYQLKREKERNNNNKLIVHGLAGKKPKEVENIFREQTGMEIRDFLKRKYIDEELSLQDISDLIGIKPRRLSDKVRYYGLYKTSSQARKEAVKKGNIDYKTINRKGRLTRAKNISKSNKQDMIRELLKYHLQFVLDQFKDIEIITGYNEYCVLNTLEIDIPIIIFNQNKVFKLAIEYDGDIWHKDRDTDIKKENLLKEKNWKLIRITEEHTEGNNYKLLESKIKEIVNQIIEIIRTDN